MTTTTTRRANENGLEMKSTGGINARKNLGTSTTKRKVSDTIIKKHLQVQRALENQLINRI